MNAFNTINLAGAVILTSTDFAQELGVPESKWVYPLGGAGTRDSYDCEHSFSFLIRHTDTFQSGNDLITTLLHPFLAPLMLL